MRPLFASLLVVTLVLPACAPVGSGPQLIISANENRLDLAYGAMKVFGDREPDSLTVLDLSCWPPKVTHIDGIANSVLGPPTNVAITPDQTLALVANSVIIDPADATKQIPGRTIHLIDLTTDPPAKIGEVTGGLQPSGISINPAGTLALVANRADGTVSVFAIEGKSVRLIESVQVGTETSEVSHVAISPDGRLALASKRMDNSVALMVIDGRTVTYDGHDMATGIKPYAVEISADGTVAIVANGGEGRGDFDTAAIIDLTCSPPRVVNHVSIGIGPEHLVMSPDGRLVAVALMNGSNLAADHPFRTEQGLVRLFRRRGTTLTLVDEQLVGAVPEGVAFTNDGRYLVVQNYVARTLGIFRVAGDKLHPTGHEVKLPGQPAAIRAPTRAAE